MRLEEWRSYIESRFLDDEEESVEPETIRKAITAGELPAEYPVPTPLSAAAVVHVTYTPEVNNEAAAANLERQLSLSIFPVIESKDTEPGIPEFAKFIPSRNREALTASIKPSTRKRPVRRIRSSADQGKSTVILPPYEMLQKLMMESEEEDFEVAGRYYKRPFRQSRKSLIERLLDPVLSLEEASRLLNVSPAAVRRYTNRGVLSCIRKESSAQKEERDSSIRETRQRRFRLSDLLLFLQRHAELLETERKADPLEENLLS